MYHWLFPLTSNKLKFLYLDGNKLNGIPEYLGNLCNLAYLHISQNSMSVKFSDLMVNLSSGCTSVALNKLDVSYNQLTGSLSDNIQKFVSLRYLDLSNNQLNEILCENVWRLPKLEMLDVSSNFLTSFIPKYVGETKISTLYLSNNSFDGTPPNIHMSDHSSIQEIDISSCNLGPHFPNWILKLKKLTLLNIANNRISYTIPIHFWNMWFPRLDYLDLSSNNFSGSVPNVSSGLQRLDLSHNKFYGQISFLCQITDMSLFFLDLSNNSFVGEIPNCLWHFKELQVLNLGHNNFSGRLPISIGYLISLEVLKLDNNKFSGELPLSLQNCTGLTFLELGVNKFSGYVPIWIGEQLSQLYALSLTSNNFFGTIPSQLCQLVNLQILDLSMNRLNGTIPSCLNNLTSLFHDGFSSYQNQHYLNGSNSRYVDHALIYWQGSVRDVVHHAAFFFIHSLLVLGSLIDTTSRQARDGAGDLKCIENERQALLHFKSYIRQDPQGTLSSWTQYEKREEATSDCCDWSGVTCNNQTGHVITLDLSEGLLEGKISPSLVNLTYLTHLDLSYNHFRGPIPMFIGSITQLRYLGLGGNYFIGTIPMELGNLTKLQQLYLHFLSNCTIENLNWLSTLSHLEGLNMDGTSLAKANNWVNVMLGLKKLSHLSLWRCDLSQVMISYSYSSFNSSSTSTSIISLYLTDNNLNSSMYHWLFPLISDKLEDLYLDNNKLVGIPKYLGNLCNLAYLRISQNSMSVKFYDLMVNLSSGCTSSALEELRVSYNQLTGIAREFRNNIGMLKSIDLSNNFLTGQIPYELTSLLELMQVNLSNNALSGAIPDKTGRIPVSTQLQSFEALRYIGNVGLCGLPLPKYCPGDKELKAPIISQNEGGGEGIDELDRLFLIGGASGFTTGFWIVCCGLHVNWHGRNEFFRFLDNLKDWVYIKVTVFIARRQRNFPRSLIDTTSRQARDGAGDLNCIEKERQALLHFKHIFVKTPKELSLHGHNMKKKEEATSDCCDWSGVTCNN
ncbi:hypothetical protein QVD17_01039 [Tagetes erecta]|uniref:Leucine-rich repeat-containing N-terminal plant-type domain-containing protein n=1 Tax=Tagetes erecta TaxID=13708 RepID=A0AAD8L915_TARER|nr:hypothetical protein QVD17_01039 [Tagetes erecta]